MSQNSKNPNMRSSTKGININKAIDIFPQAEKNKTKGVCSTSSTNVVDTHGGPSVGTSVTRKTFVTKMKTLKKKLVQESDSDVDEDWVTFVDLVQDET